MTCVRGEEPAWLSWFPVSERILKGTHKGNQAVLVDVGGGRGHDAIAFKHRMSLELFPGGRVVLEDLPTVLDDVGQLDAGVEKVEHDFFTPQVIIGEFTCSIFVVLHWFKGG